MTLHVIFIHTKLNVYKRQLYSRITEINDVELYYFLKSRSLSVVKNTMLFQQSSRG